MPYPILKNRIVKKTQRVGRGVGSGRGRSSGRGNKGQLARTGASRMRLKESGHTPLYRRLPALRGFNRHWVGKPEVINIDLLNKSFAANEEVSLVSLRQKKLISSQAKSFKILSQGEIDHSLTIATDLFSKAAKAKLDKAGCKFIAPVTTDDTAAESDEE